MSLGERRDDIIFSALPTRKSAEEIDQDIRRALVSDKQERGAQSEATFARKVRVYFAWMINEVRESTPYEDVEGIDFFVTFKNGQTLPVQVKSSDRAVYEFKTTTKYIDHFRRKIIVINSSPDVTKRKFKHDFFHELKRIEKLTNPK